MKFFRFSVILSLFALSAFGQAGLLPGTPQAQFFDSNGNPLAGGRVWTYSAGTSTLLASFTDSTMTVANPNPVILDGSGRANIWLSNGVSYKVRLENVFGVSQWTVDNVTAIGSIGGGGGGVTSVFGRTGAVVGTAPDYSAFYLQLSGGTMSGSILASGVVNLGNSGARITKLWLTDLDISGTCTGAACGGGGGSPLTTKGDIFGFSTVGARIPVGANGLVLTADSTQPLGVGWAAPGSGAFLPLTGGTMSGNIQSSTVNTLAVGSKPNPFSAGYFQTNASTKSLEIYDSAAADLTGGFLTIQGQAVTGSNVYMIIRDTIGNPMLNLTRTLGGVNKDLALVDMTVTPITDNTRDLGGTFPVTGGAWRDIYWKGRLVQGSTVRMDASGNATVNNLTISGTCSGCPGTGGGTFLPLGGGTMAGNILANAVNTLSMGSKPTPFASGYFQTNASTKSLEIYDSAAADLTGGFFTLQAQVLSGTNVYAIFRDTSSNPMLILGRTFGSVNQDLAKFDLNLVPITDNTRDLGGVFPATGAAWRDVFFKGRLVQGSTTVLDAGGNLTVTSCIGCGGGGFTGGTITSSILPTPDNALNLGSGTQGFASTFSHNVLAENLKIANPSTSFATAWIFNLASASNLRLTDSTSTQVLSIATSGINNYQWGIRGTLFPTDLTIGDADLGIISAPFGKLYLNSGFLMNGTTVIDASRNASVQNLTVSGTCTGCGGGGASLSANNTWTGINTFVPGIQGNSYSATGTGSALTFVNSDSNFSVDGNGNIGAAGNVTASGTGTFGVLTITGSATSTIAGNLNVTGSATTLRNETIISSGGFGSGLLFLAAGSQLLFNPSATVTPPSGSVLNGLQSCPGGQHVATFTVSQGFVTAFTCS